MIETKLLEKNENEQIDALMNEIREGAVLYNQACHFFEKQKQAKYKELIGKHWEAMEMALADLGKLPSDFNFSRDAKDVGKYALTFTSNSLYLITRSEKEIELRNNLGPFASFVESFMMESKDNEKE
jgi:hypothetical protein